MEKFIELFLSALLSALLLAVGGRVLGVGTDFFNKHTESVNNDIAYSYDQSFVYTISYGYPMPITSIYAVLAENEEKLQSMTLTYYKKGANNTLVQTAPKKYDFTMGGVDDAGNTLSEDEYRLYIINQLRYLFAEKATIDGTEDKDTGMFDISISQVPREMQTTSIVK